MGERKISPLYRLIKAAVQAVYPKIKVVGEENLPPEPVVYVGNHSQMNGPIACELYTPGEHYIIAPLSQLVFTNANTIGVYHDAKIITTFKKTVTALQEGASVVIFPEHHVPRNNIICEFQDRFIDVAKLYYKRTGKALAFVPQYLAPSLKTMYLGKPIRFQPDAPLEEERRRICEYLMEQVTEMAQALPKHIVVPYPNMPKKQYPCNIPQEATHEKTGN